ncbi:hypothetical protein JAAARDRAFT_67922 [Jaapia argillacea MUCL 33604]|uniref:O-methyltransferase C-terminal domain-containing protein n=1 Tax=Jaapia argillacea MUCL 33604 TaxID=933084 RepID=A0A067Q070_9AGAM|nr:hypothetical protein JAAARDRAFT_67922 [Jaapia argillacea MUCL 33604]
MLSVIRPQNGDGIPFSGTVIPDPLDSTHLTDLVALISSAVGVVISEYNTSVRRLLKAVQIIEGACVQLCATIAGPGRTMINKASDSSESACLQIATRANISDHLLDKPDGLHISDLTRLSGLDADRLGRILRRLATVHCYSEVKPNVFANNRLSFKLLSTDPVSDYVGLITGECLKAVAYLPDTLLDPETTHTQSPDSTVFYQVFGCRIFDYCAKYKEYGERFNRAMIGYNSAVGKSTLVEAYPWSTLPRGTRICDVGGGNGHRMIELVKVYPQLKVIVQDREAVLQDGKKLWATERAEAVEEDKDTFTPLDFFSGIPVLDCEIYYVSLILHDWPDAECVTILSNVRKAMNPSSRILIHECVLQNAVPVKVTGTRQVIQPAEPLLPNYGAGKVGSYNLDMIMMTNHNGKERMLDEFVDIGNRAGLQFVRIWECGEAGLVEFSLP